MRRGFPRTKLVTAEETNAAHENRQTQTINKQRAATILKTESKYALCSGAKLIIDRGTNGDVEKT